MPPGSHELMVRFDFEVPTGGSFGSLGQMTVAHLLHNAAVRPLSKLANAIAWKGARWRYTPNIRLYNAARQLLAEERSVNCL